MAKGIHNFSEIGKLEKVLLHRVGAEVETLVPSNFERLLFDDIPYLKVAKEEHDGFANLLRENGVEVVYYQDETAKALEEESVRKLFVKDFLKGSGLLNKDVTNAVSDLMLSLTPDELVKLAIRGVRKDEIDIDLSKFYSPSSIEYPYLADPMPNLYFTRDPGACIGDGINIHHMSTAARRREAMLLEYMYNYNKDFAPEGTNKWYDYNDAFSIEGGDVLVLSDKIVAVGYSQRTSIDGIENFTKNLLSKSDYEKVLVFDIPKSRAFMHLDTVFTMVDYDKFTIHPEIEGPLQVFQVTLDSKGEIVFTSYQGHLEDILSKLMGLPAVKLFRCGAGDPVAAAREQWNDGSNTLAIAPGKVITYERNYVTNDYLDKNGIEVLTIPSAELSRGRGGPRCMSCPVRRKDL